MFERSAITLKLFSAETNTILGKQLKTSSLEQTLFDLDPKYDSSKCEFLCTSAFYFGRRYILSFVVQPLFITEFAFVCMPCHIIYFYVAAALLRVARSNNNNIIIVDTGCWHG